MTTTPHAAAAAAARQRLANVLGTLQANPNVPASVLEILSGLARAMGPLFQLERGSADLSQFQTARVVLQETLEKIQVADQSFPGVSEATAAVAETLGTIFKAMREAGLVPGAGGAQAQPQQPQQPAASPMPMVSQQPAQAPQAFPMQQPQQPQGGFQPFGGQPQQPAQAPQAFPMQQPQQPQAQPFAMQPKQPQAQPFAMQPQQPAPQQPPFAQPPAQSQQGHRPPSGAMKAPGQPPVAATPTIGSVPLGPNGLPRLESEIGVHSETNFYTDFLGDIRANGGVFVATFHVLPIGSQCEVLLTFPGNLTAEFRGTVRWKRENAQGVSMTSSPGLGIQISQADGAAWDLIERFVRKREPIMHEM